MNNREGKARQFLEEGCHIYESGDFSLAAQMFHRAIKYGSTEGKVNLGNMYSLGEGVPINLQKAKRLYRSAFREGCAYGASSLGTQYLSEGKLNLAEKWLINAIEMGNEWAKEDLAKVLLKKKT
jgi:uncharacterized protein